MISSALSRVSAAILLLGGAALLFAPDVLLPALVPGFPRAAAWLGQLLAAAWLGVAALNWLQRGAVLGGIYGRPVVLANLALYLVSALSLLRAVAGGAAPAAAWGALALAAPLAAGYGALLLRGRSIRRHPPPADGALQLTKPPATPAARMPQPCTFAAELKRQAAGGPS